MLRSTFACLGCVLVIIIFPGVGVFGPDKPNFSGSYTLKEIIGPGKAKKLGWTLRVFQTDSAVEITRVQDGHQYVNKFQLDSSERACVIPGKPAGRCKAKLVPKRLVVDLSYTRQPDDQHQAVAMHETGRWELSLDSKTLKIRTDVDPFQIGNRTAVPDPHTEIYIRN
jgi:hypothetical protein